MLNIMYLPTTLMGSEFAGKSRAGSVKSAGGKFYHWKSNQAKVIKTARRNNG